MLLGPFDEIGHDQEIAGEPHLFDDVDFKGQPGDVFLTRGGQRDDGEPLFQAFKRLTAQLIDLVIGEFRQDRRAFVGHEGTALRDLHRVLQGLGQIGEEGRHLGFGLEVMLWGQATAWFLLVNIGTLGNADQRVMRLIHLRFREIDVIGRHQGQAHLIGKFDMPAFGPRLGFGQTAALAGVALQFDIKPLRIDRRQAFQDRAGLGPLPGCQQAAQGTIRPTGQADQPLSMVGQFVQSHLRQLPALAEIEARVQLHQVHVTRLVLG